MCAGGYNQGDCPQRWAECSLWGPPKPDEKYLAALALAEWMRNENSQRPRRPQRFYRFTNSCLRADRFRSFTDKQRAARRASVRLLDLAFRNQVQQNLPHGRSPL